MPLIIAPSLAADMLAAVDAAGSHVVFSRASFLAANLAAGIAPSAVQPGRKVALLRCSPPPCVELWAVSDIQIATDWEVAP